MVASSTPREVTIATPGLPSPTAPHERIRAVLFDLDGTLYSQRKMRTFMAAELLASTVRHPFRAPRHWRGLAEYRRAQEALRHMPANVSVGSAQLNAAATRSGIPVTELKQIVDEWIFERPLKHMAACRAPGLIGLLMFLGERGIPMGVLSDYSPTDKLRALGADRWFSLRLCSTDAEIDAFKPDPRGFRVACARWNLSPREVLVVGDRVEVDAAGAAAAGMPCVIVERSAERDIRTADVIGLPSLERLHDVLAHGR